ncbi:MAG TPA: Na+/H+ antiporter NhaA [Terriglobia bacterium]
MEASGGIILLICTAVAIGWANSPWEHSYEALWDAPLTIHFGSIFLSETRHHWINDGLMSVFFFLVGLEIKREVLIGELSSLKQAAFPFIAALGGSTIPALIYFLATRGTGAERGWAVPMATDIAFALGVLALLGDRVPVTLKVFVAALAIVDDIFAVLVIAVFYTAHISMVSVGVALAGLAICCLANWLGVRKPAVYAVISVFVWLAVLKSGIHATIAGVLLAFTIPAKTLIDRPEFLERSRSLLGEVEAAEEHSAEEHDAVHALELQCELIQSPLHRIEHRLQPWVSFFIMPVFALANAGVHILGNIGAAATHPVTIGVVLGLLAGKPLGIATFAWLAAKSKMASPPAAMSWKKIFGASWLCGIGFTMSLFIASLAFGEGTLLDMSKIGILFASLLAGVAGAIILRTDKQPQAPTGLTSSSGGGVP